MPIPLDGANDTSANSPDSPSASPSVLAGDTGQNPTAGNAPSETDGGLREVVQKVRAIQVDLMDLARQFPSAAVPLRQAGSALRAALRQVVANPGSPEPPPPNVGG